ncbi:g9833 [Coccomyxa elongata]
MGFPNSFTLLAVTASVALSLLSCGNAQVVPGTSVAAEVLAAEISPGGTTFYGTPRTFSATVINIGTGSTTLDGNITFLAAGVPICTAPLIANNSLVSTQVTLNSLSLSLASGLLTQILPTLLPLVRAPIDAAITTAGGIDATVIAVASPIVGPLTVNAAAFAVCTTSTIPVGTYTQLSVAYAGLAVGGVSTGIPSLLPAVLGPLVNLGDFQVVKATDSVSAANPAPALPGASTPLTVTVSNLNAPPSVLPPDGGTVTAFLGTTQIGTGPLTSFSGTTGTATFPIKVPANTPAGPQTITLQYSGTSNFAPSASGQNGSPAGPTLTVPYVPTFTATPTPSPAPAGTLVSVAGTVTTPGGGPAPPGTVTLMVNGVKTGPFTLTTPATGSVSTFAGTLTAPNNPAGSPFPVTIDYTPGSPAFAAPTPAPTFPLPVGPATASVTATATPPNPATGTPVTVTGKVTGSNGLTPSGTVNIQANGTTVGTATVNTDGTYTGSFVPTNPGTIIVTAAYVPSATSTVGPGTSPPTTVTVTPSTATVTTAVAPNPSAPNGTVVASGTVTTTGGSPSGGTVTVSINGQPVGTGPVGSDGKFSIPFTAPSATGNYTVVTSFTPAGGSAPTGGGSAQLTVSTTGTATVTTAVAPNPSAPNGTVVASGTVTTTSGSPAGGTVTVTINGQPVGTGTVGSDGKFNIPFTAPGAPGTYTVVTSFTPAGGSAPTGGGSASLTVSTTGTDSITSTISPNPGSPGGSETASGTVTTATGSPGGGTVTVTINGQTVGTATVGADGKFSIPFTAPTTPGTYTVITSFTPSGASAPTAVVATTFVVGSGGTGSTTITIGFGNGSNGGFAFPNCIGPLTVSVSGSGSPSPTGNVTLQLSGGKLGNNAVAIGTASFANGVATFNLESLKVKTELLNKFITHLGEFKSDLTKENILDYSLLPAGDFLLLPGDYTLTALYPGDGTYGASSGSAPFNIDPLCLLVALTFKA